MDDITSNNEMGDDKCFGVLILITHYLFASQSNLWYSMSQCKYIKPPVIGKKVLTRLMFDHLWSCIRFSRQQQPRMEGTNMKEWEWQLVNGHIENFNKHILASLSPLERIFLDEIFGRWYGLGGDLRRVW